MDNTTPLASLPQDIRYIGTYDSDLDLFESQYPVPEGITYNSYVIIDDEIAVFDTADKRKRDQWLANLRAALGTGKPSYLIVLHLEPDHAACIADFMQLYPDATIVASAKALHMLPLYFDESLFEGRTMAMADGSVLTLGRHSLRFIAAPMIHWPEVMMALDVTEGLLFSADAFGTFGTNELTAPAEWADEARRYYINIVGKYGAQVHNLLEKLSGIDGISAICPLHGPVLPFDPGYLALYDRWSRYLPESDGVVVAYASMHGNTAAAARHCAEALSAAGVSVELIDLCRCDISHAVAMAFKMSHLVLAAATYDGGVFTPMHDFLYRLSCKTYRNRTVALIENGSWAPVAAKTMRTMLEQMKGINIIEPTVTIKGAFKADDVAAIDALIAQLTAR